jgi:hypothetical protein
MNRYVGLSCIAVAVAIAPSVANAQGGRAVFHAGTAEIVNVEPMDVPAIAGAPFSAEATTEFTQLLSDGNRIERRFSTSLARDGRGRTRSEQDVAMLGPLTVLHTGVHWKTTQSFTVTSSGPPRFTVIADPVERVTYTLDERTKEARRSPSKFATVHVVESRKIADKLELVAHGTGGTGAVVESLGTRQIEGVSAEGTRVTTTIAAGQIGNLNPIHLVSERWYSKDLQMAVLITRRDPRSGDTVYRLTNIVRNEPPPDLFAVPSDYRIVDLNKFDHDKKLIFDKELKKLDKVRTGQ